MKNLSSLQYRILSGVVLGPLTLAIIYVRGIPLIVFSLIAAGLALREWVRMARLGDRVQKDIAIGVVYISVSVASFIDLGLRHQGFFLLMGLLLCIWASDIGAYATGKFIGGKKLCPSISPNKTWAGLAGAMFFAGVSLSLCVTIFDVHLRDWRIAFCAGLVFGAMGQAGDLLISAFKRRVGVKDTGTLIPGHGGLLDRIDSLLLVSPVYLLAFLLWL